MKAITVKEILEAVNGRLISGNDNILITNVCTDSRKIEQDGLFVPIIGEKVDAHDFIESILINGGSATFTNRELDNYLDKKAYILVDDSVTALQALGKYYRSKFDIPIIGITGSVGKTSTKEMIFCALKSKFNVLKTLGNMNSQVGLPLMLFHLNDEHEIGVIEMGISENKEMSRLCNVSMPHDAVITNIGVSHIAQLGTRKNIMLEKLNIINHFDDSSTLFLNGDDELLKTLIDNNVTKNIISYGLSKECTFRAENIITDGDYTVFTLYYPDGKEEIRIPVLGMHNVYNALVSIAIANKYGILPGESKLGLLDYAPIAMRGQIGVYNGVKLIDDSYNASPDSIKGGINILLSLSEVNKRIAVLADVLELGDISYECHYEIGKYIVKNPVDEVITIGKNSLAIYNAINAEASHVIKATPFKTNDEAINYLKSILKSGDGVLVKGSRGMHTEEIVNAIKER